MTRPDYHYTYDVALSFASDDRSKAEQLATLLTGQGFRVFYDRYEQDVLWGKDLYQRLQEVYRDSARYCVVFVSASYRARLWPNQELKHAQARAFRESQEYILPLRLDDSELPGLNDTTAYLDLRQLSLEQVAQAVQRKVVARTDCTTWHETPIALNEFSEKLRIGVADTLRRAVDDLLRALTVRGRARYAPYSEVSAELRSVVTPKDLDIELTCLDAAGTFVHHPWPRILGSSLQSQWVHRPQFQTWMLERMEDMKRGCLTWTDDYSSNPRLELEVRLDRRKYRRRTLVGFERLALSQIAIPLYIAVEGHEIEALGERAAKTS